MRFPGAPCHSMLNTVGSSELGVLPWGKPQSAASQTPQKHTQAWKHLFKQAAGTSRTGSDSAGVKQLKNEHHLTWVQMIQTLQVQERPDQLLLPSSERRFQAKLSMQVKINFFIMDNNNNVVCMCAYAQECVGTCAHRGQRSMAGVFPLSLPSPFFGEAGSFTEQRAHQLPKLACQRALGFCLSYPVISRSGLQSYRCVSLWAFTWMLEIWMPDHMLAL